MRAWLGRTRQRDRRLLTVARGLERDGLVVGSVGNVSVRAGSNIRITPTALPYPRMRRADLVTVDVHTAVTVSGANEPSRELPLHVAVYRARPDVGAIVHCHSAWATAWSFLGLPLEPATEDVLYYRIGGVATAPRAPTGSGRLAYAAARALGSSRAVLLHSHGTLAVGATVEEAATVARAVEHQARVCWLLRVAGVPPSAGHAGELPASDIEHLAVDVVRPG